MLRICKNTGNAVVFPVNLNIFNIKKNDVTLQNGIKGFFRLILKFAPGFEAGMIVL